MDTTDTLTITLPEGLTRRVAMEATVFGITPTERALQALDGTVAPADNFAEGNAAKGMAQLTDFLRRVPSVTLLSFSPPTEPQWWIKLKIDITSPVAWHVVQGLGFVLNYISIDEPLPTVFRPVSAPPYLNGGPDGYLAWVIEARIPFLDAGVIASFLKGRLPHPVEEKAGWLEVDDADSEESDSPDT